MSTIALSDGEFVGSSLGMRLETPKIFQIRTYNSIQRNLEMRTLFGLLGPGPSVQYNRGVHISGVRSLKCARGHLGELAKVSGI